MQLARDELELRLRQTLEQVQRAAVDLPRQWSAEPVLGGPEHAAADRVRHPGAKADAQPARARRVRQGADSPQLADRVDERGEHLRELVGGEAEVEVIQLARTQARRRAAQQRLQARGRGGGERVLEFWTGRDLQPTDRGGGHRPEGGGLRGRHGPS